MTTIDMDRAQSVARRFLRRWRDRQTRAISDDIIGQAMLYVWRDRQSLADPDMLDGWVRTIVRRARCELLGSRRTKSSEGLAAYGRAESLDEALHGELDHDHRLACHALQEALRCVSDRNADMLLDQARGYSCGELSARYGMSVGYVKVTLCRARSMIRAVAPSWVREAAR